MGGSRYRVALGGLRKGKQVRGERPAQTPPRLTKQGLCFSNMNAWQSLGYKGEVLGSWHKARAGPSVCSLSQMGPQGGRFGASVTGTIGLHVREPGSPFRWVSLPVSP